MRGLLPLIGAVSAHRYLKILAESCCRYLRIQEDTGNILDMSTATAGLRVAPEQKNPEDIRVGETLKSLLHRVEQTPQGYYLPRTITHEELAKQVRTRRSPRGVSRGYITQLCNGEKHMTNEVLYAIAHYLGVNPVAIKQPDPEPQLHHLFAAA